MACTKAGQSARSGSVNGVTATRLARELGTWHDRGASNERLAATIRSLILDGRVGLQTRLPAERALAGALGISRATVTAAYTRLRDEGYLASRHGAGTWATLPAGHRAAADAVLPAEGFDLRIAALPAPPLLAELAADAAAELPRWLDQHGYEPLGLPPLRTAIASRFSWRGMTTGPEQILVTSGAMHALNLTIGTLLRPGHRAIVEVPSYPAALDALRAAGAHLHAVPVDASGWDLASIAAAASDGEGGLAYLVPDFQNPTGALIDARSRRRALRSLAQSGCQIVVDETFVELNLDQQPMPPPAAALCPATITIGSLDKAVWGGLRIGWIRADPLLIRRLAQARATTDLASPVLEQLLATRVLEQLDGLLADRCALAATRRTALLQALDAQLPSWRYVRPPGGLFVWAELPQASSTALAVRAQEHNLYLTPGPRFGGAGLLERFLRLPFTVAPEQLRQAVATLSRLTSEQGAAAAPSLDPGYVA